MNEPIQPEELTELLDDDLEMWAQGGTRILPKSELQRAKPDSFPPVAYASVPPPSVAPPPAAPSSAPLWAALIGMAAVFCLAAVGGGISYALHRASATTESAASTNVTPATTTTSEPEQVTLTPTTTAAPVTNAAPTATTTHKVATSTVAAPPPVVRYGTIQTFAVGAGKPVFLDGKPIGTGGSHIKAACGKHSVSVGMGKAKTYDIPCNGTPITVGTPDGV